MKLIVTFLFIASMACVLALSADEEWAAYKVKYEKNYDADEEAKRFDIFKENLAFVEEHNAKFAKGETTFEVGINHFADQTEDEKSHSRGLVRPLGLGKKEE